MTHNAKTFRPLVFQQTCHRGCATVYKILFWLCVNATIGERIQTLVRKVNCTVSLRQPLRTLCHGIVYAAFTALAVLVWVAKWKDWARGAQKSFIIITVADILGEAITTSNSRLVGPIGQALFHPDTGFSQLQRNELERERCIQQPEPCSRQLPNAGQCTWPVECQQRDPARLKVNNMKVHTQAEREE